jgi:hypothetical protein
MFDYPSKEIGKIITINENSSLVDGLISEIGAILYLNSFNEAVNLETYTKKSLQEDINSPYTNWTVFENIKPVKYSNLTGYEFKIYDGEKSIMTNVILKHDDLVLKFVGFSMINDYSTAMFEKMVNSLNFLPKQ